MKYLIYYTYLVILGALVGIVLWFFLYLANTGIHFFWLGYNETLNGGILYLTNHDIIVLFIFIIGGSLLAALLFQKIGIMPPNVHEVAQKFNSEKEIEYQKFFIIFLTSLIPLFLGASVGPEASLIIFSIYLYNFAEVKATKFEKKYKLILVKNEKEKFKEKIKTNYLYTIKILILGVVGMGTFLYITSLDKFPPFFIKLASPHFSIISIIYIIPLILIGFLLGKYYIYTEKITEKIFQKIKNNYLKILITSSIIFLSAIFSPWIILSGEGTLPIILEQYTTLSIFSLLIISLLNILLTHICINGNLRGGHIFPIIMSSFSMGLAFSFVFNIDITIAISCVMIGMVFTLFRKTLGVFLFLTLFIPIYLLIPLTLLLFAIKYLIVNQKKSTKLEDFEEEYEVKNVKET